MRFVIAPDSYKGSLNAREAAMIMSRAVRAELPQVDIHLIPMADGGEGTGNRRNGNPNIFGLPMVDPSYLLTPLKSRSSCAKC